MVRCSLLHAEKGFCYIASSIGSSRLSYHHAGKRRWQSTNAKDLPTAAEIVIAGGGITGSSVAYHLAKLGKRDVVVLEQGSLGCGTTWHSVGLLGRVRGSQCHYNMCTYGFELYSNLEKDTGLSTGIKKCGGLLVVQTKDREISFRRLYDRVKTFGHECELVSPKDAQELFPVMRIDDLRMAIWSPNEGALNASDACSSLMRGATQRGVKFFDGVGVRKVCTNGKRVVGVETDSGYIHCEKFINCGGQWARELGLRTDNPVNLPLHSCEHFYIVTKPMEGVHSMLPVLRDYDAYIYIREWSGGLLAGGFEPIAKPCFYEKGVPDKFEFQLLSEDWDHFDILMQGTLNRIPSIENAEIRQFVNGPESFTPDGNFLFGEVPEVENYFAACGMCSSGIMNAPAMGKLTAELVTEGACSWDVSVIDIKRLTKEQNNKLFLRDRVKQVLGQYYGVPYPDLQNTAARPLKTPPLFDLLTMKGAAWDEIGGWERARWFNRDSTEFKDTFGKPGWFDSVKEEYTACNENAGIADMSWQTKLEVMANDATSLINELQRLFAVDVDLPVGSSTTSALLDHSGCYIAIADIHRLTEDRFLLVTLPTYHNHVISWISKTSSILRIEDVTSRYGCIGIFGPSGIDLLQKLTLTPLNEFSNQRNKVVDLGNASNVILHRRSLGSCDNWQAFVPYAMYSGVYKSIFDAGTAKDVGHYAVDSLRIDAGIPEMGKDIGRLSSPLDFGEFSFVDMNKTAQYIGKEAVQDVKCNKSLQTFTFECDDDNWAWGGEPVYADGKSVGKLASVSVSFSRNKMVALSVLPMETVANSDELVVRIAGKDKLLQICGKVSN